MAKETPNFGSILKIQTDPNTGLIDPSHELYLYPFDNPNNVLVSDLLEGQNYSHWRKAMEVMLITKNKIRFVKGTCAKPDVTSRMFNQWD